MTRSQKSRMLRVVQSVNNLLAVLLAEINTYRESESEVPACFSSMNELELISFSKCNPYLGSDVDAVLNIPNANRVVPSTTVKGIC